MVPPRLFETRQFAAANGANFLLAFAMFSGFVMVVQFFATVLHESPVSVGVHSLFWTAAPMIVSPYGARLGRVRGPIQVAIGGMVLTSLGLLTIAMTVGPGTDALALAPGLLATGTGIGLVLPNVVAAALAVVPEADIGKASGVLNTARQVGAVAGVAVGVAVFQAAGGVGASELSDGIRAALLVSALAAASGAVAAMLGGRRLAEAAAGEVAAAEAA
jgi:MFS family permease